MRHDPLHYNPMVTMETRMRAIHPRLIVVTQKSSKHEGYEIFVSPTGKQSDAFDAAYVTHPDRALVEHTRFVHKAYGGYYRNLSSNFQKRREERKPWIK